MIDEDALPQFKGGASVNSALSALVREDLDPYSVEDLKTRIETLEGEIARAGEMMERKKNRRTAADALFSFKGN